MNESLSIDGCDERPEQLERPARGAVARFTTGPALLLALGLFASAAGRLRTGVSGGIEAIAVAGELLFGVALVARPLGAAPLLLLAGWQGVLVLLVALSPSLHAWRAFLGAPAAWCQFRPWVAVAIGVATILLAGAGARRSTVTTRGTPCGG